MITLHTRYTVEICIVTHQRITATHLHSSQMQCITRAQMIAVYVFTHTDNVGRGDVYCSCKALPIRNGTIFLPHIEVFVLVGWY